MRKSIACLALLIAFNDGECMRRQNRPTEPQAAVAEISPPAQGRKTTRNRFTLKEDALLRATVAKLGTNDWTIVQQRLPERTTRQVKDRWTTYLSPNLNTSPWTDEEDSLLLQKREELGPRWLKISKFFDSRTDASVKNRFHILERRSRRGKRSTPTPPQAPEPVSYADAQTNTEEPIQPPAALTPAVFIPTPPPILTAQSTPTTSDEHMNRSGNGFIALPNSWLPQEERLSPSFLSESDYDAWPTFDDNAPSLDIWGYPRLDMEIRTPIPWGE
ncbi:MAG: hypothetical protein LBL99_02600 [Holosporaceae bacterium]|jgi:hypothetical protein|nr:hypothetical protein [Holosporaceae bacterium]